VGNDVIIFQHQYPGVGGAQLINHFVSGGVRYYIHIPKKREGAARPDDGSDTPRARLSVGEGAPIHGSWITDRAADNRGVS